MFVLGLDVLVGLNIILTINVIYSEIAYQRARRSEDEIEYQRSRIWKFNMHHHLFSFVFLDFCSKMDARVNACRMDLFVQRMNRAIINL